MKINTDEYGIHNRPDGLWPLMEMLEIYLAAEATEQVALTEGSNYSVSTIGNVPDTGHMYETAIIENDLITIVEEYNTLEEAKKGHDRWFQYRKDNPNSSLEDVSTSKYKLEVSNGR